MILKHLALYLSNDEYPRATVVPFGFRTRSLCNFLERRLRTLRFHAEGFSKICVQGRHVALPGCPVVSEHAALPTFVFDEARYPAARGDDEHELFLEWLGTGLQRCARVHRIPLAELQAAMEEFRAGGYRNEWDHQRKLLRQVGLRARLGCTLDRDRFTLRLGLERKGTPILERQVLETKPDELIFGPQLGTVALEGDAIVVRNSFGETLASVDAAGL